MSDEGARRDVLLVAAELEERRLLYGELLEAGYNVLPVPGYAAALGVLLQRSVEPRLIVIDVRGDEHATPQSVEYLMKLAPTVPLLLLVGAVDKSLWEPLKSRVAGLLVRPITIGAIVDTIRRMLPPAQRDL